MARKVRREVPKEIADCGGRKARRGGLNPGGRRNANPNSPLPRLRAAFTLTELLVVIAIIAILTALIVPAVMRAREAAKEAAVMVEVNQLGSAIEELKNQYGSYPPNGMCSPDNATNFKGDPVLNITKSNFVRWFKKAFPRSQEPVSLLQGLAGDTSQTYFLDGGLRADEAVYFWLGGFSSDPQFPLSGPGGPSFDSNETEVIESRNRLYEFDLTRLGPRDSSTKAFDTQDGRSIRYLVDLNRDGDTGDAGEARVINFWTYNASDTESNFVYFATNHDPVDYDQDLSGALGAAVYAPIKLREGFNTTTGTPTAKDYVFVNKDKFQILHPGLDNSWGQDFANFDLATYFDTPELMTYPEGPFTGEIADTLSNFSNGRFDKAQE